ncbi:MAG: hypothetical protein BWY72_02179 [Bacteroidetes bacterium ADurb.Bin416]|nr:MAG: hypothetical protein BWY72_02179 [Bacteroidetes bacterium ADurb.Bin416]
MKKAEIGIDVERQTVHGDMTAALHAYCTDFSGLARDFSLQPDTGSTFKSTGFHFMTRQKTDNGFFQQVDVLLEP